MRARLRPPTGMTVKSFDDEVGDMRLYPEGGARAESGPLARPNLTAVTPPVGELPARVPSAASRFAGAGRSPARPPTRPRPRARAAKQVSDMMCGTASVMTASNALDVPRTTSTTNATNATTTPSTRIPNARPLRYLTFPLSLPFASTAPSTPLTAFPSSTSFSSSCLTISCLPPPRLHPSRLLPGLPCQIYLAGRGRAVQREAVDGPSSKAQAWSGIWAGGGAAAWFARR